MAVLRDTFNLEEIQPPIWEGVGEWYGDTKRVVQQYRFKTGALPYAIDDYAQWRFKVPHDEFWRPVWFRFYAASGINRITGYAEIPVIGYDEWEPKWDYVASDQTTKTLEAGPLVGANQYLEYFDTPYSGFPTYPFLFPLQTFFFVIYAEAIWAVDMAIQVEMDLIRIKKDAAPEVFQAALNVYKDRS